MNDHEYDDHDEIPNHHLPGMSDLQNNSGHLSHHSHHSNPKLADLDNHSGHHNNNHFRPNMADIDNRPSSNHNYNPNPKMTNLDNRPSSHHNYNPNPKYTDLDNRSNRHNNHAPPPHRHNRSSKAKSLAILATLLLLVALTALILYLIYRPKTPHFNVVAASVYLLNTTTLTTVSTTLQFTILTLNPHRHTSLYYTHLTAQVFYRDQPITPPTNLPPLIHTRRSTVVFSPVLGSGQPLPVAPGVVEGLAADEAYGMMAMRVVMIGRIRYKAGIIKTGHYGVYVGCDVVVGLNKGVLGPLPLLANHDCKVHM